MRDRISRQPVVWAAAISTILGALVQVGVLTAVQADSVGALVALVVSAIPVVTGVVGALWARRRTLPLDVPRGSRPQVLHLHPDDVYRAWRPTR